MKNITVSLDEELYRKSRIAAAAADTSVTALVREFLTLFTGSEDSKADPDAAAVLKIIQKIRKRHPGFDPKDQFQRDELHTR